MSTEPKNEAIEALRHFFTGFHHLEVVRVDAILQRIDEAAAKYPQPAVTCEQVLRCLGNVPLHSEDDHGYGIVRRCEQHVRALFASAATPARKTISIPEARQVALDAVDKADQERAAEREKESPAPAECNWPTEPGLWQRLDSGNVYVAYKDRRCKDIVIVQLAKPPHWEMHEGAVDSKWRRVPAAADVEKPTNIHALADALIKFQRWQDDNDVPLKDLSASQQECERLKKLTIPDLEVRIGFLESAAERDVARIAALEGEIAEKVRKADAAWREFDRWFADWFRRCVNVSPATSALAVSDKAHLVLKPMLLAPAAEGGGA